MYKHLVLLILIIILFILFIIKRKDTFYSAEFPYSTPAYLHQLEDSYFKNLSENHSDFKIKRDDYENLTQVPTLIFKSFDSCPNLYNLFHGFKLKTDGKWYRGENSEGITFRNECEKIFYNSSQFIRIEHPIIDIRAEDIEVDKSPSPSPSQSPSPSESISFKDTYQDFTFTGFKNSSNKKLNYMQLYDEEKRRFCNFEKELKQIFFGVKSDLKIDDIFRFVDFCFTQLCFGMIYIEHMKLTSNHYRVLPCPCKPGSFFILPERIRHQVSLEGKYYTRAKCNTCCLNLIVLFGEDFPDKFDFINSFSPKESCPDINVTFPTDEILDNIFPPDY